MLPEELFLYLITMVEQIPGVKTKEWISTGERILITGHTGLVGFGINQAALGKDDLMGLSRGVSRDLFADSGLKTVQVDLLDLERLYREVSDVEPSLVINLAAATDVDRCQKDPRWAWKMNVETTRNIVEVCRRLGIPIIHFSTDYVFPRSGGRFSEFAIPHTLTDLTGRVVNEYGRSKRQSELELEKLLQNQRLIVRISSPYDYRYSEKTGVPPLLLKLIREGKPLRLSDAKTVFTYGGDIPIGLNRLIIEKAWEDIDVVHLCGPTQQSAWDIVNVIGKYMPIKSEITEVETDEYFAGRAPRPVDGGLRSEVCQSYGIETREFENVLTQEILTV